MKTKFQWIPAVLTLSSYKVKLSLTLHNSTGRPQSIHRHCALWYNCTLCNLSKGVCTQTYKLTLTADTLHISLSLSLPFSFFTYTKSTASAQEHQVNSAVITNAAHLLNTCQCFSEVPFSTLNWNSPPGLTLRVFHWETGKGESEDMRRCRLRDGTFHRREFTWNIYFWKIWNCPRERPLGSDKFFLFLGSNRWIPSIVLCCGTFVSDQWK